MSDWKEIKTEEDIVHLMETYGGFHDSCIVSLNYACGDSMSSVTKQVKKYRNRLKIRDSERFADFGSLQESLFSCLDNSVIVCLLRG